MTDFSKTTNFTAKDALTTGDPNKLVKGADFDTEFDNIATSSATKANKVGTPATSFLLRMTSTGDLEDSGFKLTGTGGTITATAAQIEKLATVTSTAAELNILDGVTATTAELNILDGVTSNTTELNLLDGITTLSGSNTGDEAAASATVAGVVELATDAETLTGTDTTRAITPANLHSLTKSHAADGYQHLPGGLILQWGFESTGSTSGSVTYPTAFSTACYSVTLANYDAGDTGGLGNTAALTAAPGTTSFSYTSVASYNGFYWMAIGK